MTIRELLTQGTQALASAGSEDARRDAQVLLAYVLEATRATLYAYPEREVTSEQVEHFLQMVARRNAGEPIAYLIGHREFYGYDFLVDKRVLIPRPETELLVEAALSAIRQKFSAGQGPIVADIGTGSGAIPVTIALEETRLPYLYACDISTEALQVADLNCQFHHVEARVRLLQGDLLTPLSEPVDIITANLPYVGTEEMDMLSPDVKVYEPHLALFSGSQGLDLLYRFCRQAAQPGILNSHAVLLLEIGYAQREPLSQLLHQLWPEAQVLFKKDYAGWDRLVQITL
ncbi:MAG: peptide chain release factor N(5)-glutamine methyltransferase [Ktedonobacteraceae bacterium]|nr:peptide chain release factor N(5)-glutamine methyltransferase [Ktedonobacteraceae bacterium]